MANEIKTQYQRVPSKTHAHVEWVDLDKKGMLHEIIVVKRNMDGSVLFFKTNDLDEIDKRRIANILADRNINSFELYDIMAQKTLGNGCNALAYFHQLVKLLMPDGRVTEPRSGQMSGTMAMAN